MKRKIGSDSRRARRQSRRDDRRDGSGVERYRTLKAVAVVLALVVAAPGADAVVRFCTSSAGESVAHAAGGLQVSGKGPPGTSSADGLPGSAQMLGGINAAQLLDENDAFGSLARIEEAIQVAEADVPEAFEREVGFALGARDIRVSPTRDVVGYVVDGESDDMLAQETARMEGLGWSAVSLGGAQGATFMKPSGECTWALVTCTQAGDATSVVVRCVMS